MSIPAEEVKAVANGDVKDFRFKAVDLLGGSLNAILLLATSLFAGLIAYGAGRTAGSWQWLFWLSLSLLLVTGALCVTTVNSLINKIHAADLDAVRHKEVRYLYIAVTVAFALALIAGGAFGAIAKSDVQPTASMAAPNSVITDSQIIVGSTNKSKIIVQKNASGKIERIEIAP